MISLRSLCLLLTLLAAGLTLASPAAAAPCAQQIIDDWADDKAPGVDGTYAVSCYRQAIASLPEDLRSYSSAADDIQRALQALLRPDEESGGGGGGGSSGGGGGSDPPADDGAKPAAEKGERKPAASKPDPSPTTPGVTTEQPAMPEGENAAAAPPNELLDNELGDGSGSLPAPVIVVLALAGMAALVAAGWLVRRALRDRGQSADS